MVPRIPGKPGSGRAGKVRFRAGMPASVGSASMHGPCGTEWGMAIPACLAPLFTTLGYQSPRSSAPENPARAGSTQRASPPRQPPVRAGTPPWWPPRCAPSLRRWAASPHGLGVAADGVGLPGAVGARGVGLVERGAAQRVKAHHQGGDAKGPHAAALRVLLLHARDVPAGVKGGVGCIVWVVERAVAWDLTTLTGRAWCAPRSSGPCANTNRAMGYAYTPPSPTPTRPTQAPHPPPAPHPSPPPAPRHVLHAGPLVQREPVALRLDAGLVDQHARIGGQPRKGQADVVVDLGNLAHRLGHLRAGCVCRGVAGRRALKLTRRHPIGWWHSNRGKHAGGVSVKPTQATRSCKAVSLQSLAARHIQVALIFGSDSPSQRLPAAWPPPSSPHPARWHRCRARPPPARPCAPPLEHTPPVERWHGSAASAQHEHYRAVGGVMVPTQQGGSGRGQCALAWKRCPSGLKTVMARS